MTSERISDGKVVPEGEPLRIDTIKAYVTLDEEDNTEGVCAFFNGKTWMPMIGADSEMIESLQPIARQTAVATGRKISLVRFSVREVLVENILQCTCDPCQLPRANGGRCQSTDTAFDSWHSSHCMACANCCLADA